MCDTKGAPFVSFYYIKGVMDDNGMTMFMEVNDEEGWD